MSETVFSVGCALLGLVYFYVVLIGLDQWRDYRMDKRIAKRRAERIKGETE